MPIENITLAGVLLAGLGALWAAYNKALTDSKTEMNERIDKIEGALNRCEEKHDEASKEVGDLKKEVGQLTGQLAVYEKFSPQLLVEQFTNAVKEVLKQ